MQIRERTSAHTFFEGDAEDLQRAGIGVGDRARRVQNNHHVRRVLPHRTQGVEGIVLRRLEAYQSVINAGVQGFL
jgi:hypothetical protein